MTHTRTRKRNTLIALVVAAAVALIPAASAAAAGPKVLYQPSGECSRVYCSTYAKSAQLPSGKIVASFEDNNQPAVGQTFPIFTSTDNGRTFTKTGTVGDTSGRNWGNWTNPFFYVLPRALGNMPAGTLLLAGVNSPPNRHETAIQLYRSNDEGRTWAWVSEIAVGGGIDGAPSPTPVWEPYLLMVGNELIVWYSDEREKAGHDQKIVHQVTTTGTSWGPVVEDVALADRNLRPGMPIVVQMADGRYIMTYEIVGAPNIPNNYKISSNPKSWNPANAGTTIDYGGNPNVIALSNGRLAYNSGGSSDVLINTTNGTGAWVPVKTTMPAGYSRHLQPVAATGRVLILSVDFFGTNKPNTVFYGDEDLGYSAGAYFKIVNRKTGKALDINQGNLRDGSEIVQWADSGAANQQWHVVTTSDGFRNILSKPSGRALSILETSTADGARATGWVENDKNDQDWQLVSSSDGFVKIVNRNSGKLLSVLGGSAADGGQVVQWSDTGTLDQQWKLVQVAQ